MKKKLISLLLCLSLLLALPFPGAQAAAENGMVVNKTATVNDDGTYTITLEAYATGEQVTTTVTEDVPTDIILVMDQSGSMNDNMGGYRYDVCQKWIPPLGYRNYYNDEYYPLRHNNGGNETLYYRLENGEYVPVSVERTGRNGTYTYTYTVNGVTTTKTSNGRYGTPDIQFYEKKYDENMGAHRLTALKTAATTFANSVAEKAAGPDRDINTTGDNVNHRIAIVGYASRADSNNPWVNTEVFIGSNQYNYNVNASQYYGAAFQNMDSSSGQSNVAASINALAAEGATYTNYGLEMANGIFNAYPLQPNESRNRVIVLFTDGYPGRNADDFNGTAANTAIAQARIAKNNGVTVYAVGIFHGADATTSGNKDGSNTQAANWFMQQVSSNNGTPRTPSYYLSAADAGALSSIFQQIASNIQTGGSSATLTNSAVVKDIIAPSFTLPAGATASAITLKTYAYKGPDNWEENVGNAMGAIATVSGDQVSVTGFNFSENWCGTDTDTANGTTTYRGHKLEISFTVQPKPGFLGGNNVPTNTSAGIYEDENAQTPVVSFPVPYVNVPIPDVTVGAVDKNVYLLQDVLLTGLIGDTTFQAGEHVTLDLTQDNFGLQSWQNQYVDIDIVVDQAGNGISETLPGLTGDSSYKVTLTISPKSQGEVNEKSGEDMAAINVFKPELTFKDSEVYYGESVPADNSYSGNKVSEEWKHGDTASTAVDMIGNAPNLILGYTPDDSKISDNNTYTKQDIPVGVTVKMGTTPINDYTTFLHTDCSTGEDLKGGKFLLHVNTCQLTITKTGGAEGEPYVFTVYKSVEGPESEAHPYTYVTITGNGSATIYELPVGRYEITEDTAWSWRYTSGISPMSVTLTSGNSTGELTCNNTPVKPYWLNGYSTVVPNTYGGSGNATTAGGAG